MSPRFDDSSGYRFCLICGGPYDLKVLKEGERPRHVCRSCGHTHYVDPKVATVGIFQSNGGIVMLRRGIEPAYGKWVCPGGFVERGETPVDACVRESEEEAGVKIGDLRLLNVYAYPDHVVIVIVYMARLMSGVPRALDESMEVGVFPPERIPWDDLAFPSTRDSLRDYVETVRADSHVSKRSPPCPSAAADPPPNPLVGESARGGEDGGR
ncbi:MAG: NUDIX hydrolase [Nitrospirae bacterium]|nr:NUDIX hydrolase [Nitrospirota bacterium]